MGTGGEDAVVERRRDGKADEILGPLSLWWTGLNRAVHGLVCEERRCAHARRLMDCMRAQRATARGTRSRPPARAGDSPDA